MAAWYQTKESAICFLNPNLLGPRNVWNHLLWLIEVPRGSGQPELISQKLLEFGQGLGYDSFRDSAGNIIIKKPATPFKEKIPHICLHAHYDIVAVKDIGVQIDLKKDPLIPRIVPSKEDPNRMLLMATGTSLGADCGIGLAMILAILEDRTLEHGPIDALFTRDEETTMAGVNEMEQGEIKAKYIISTDFFTECGLGIGSQGSMEMQVEIPVKKIELKQVSLVGVQISGLNGGHSGQDVTNNRCNAIKLLGRAVYQALSIAVLKDQVCIQSINGGEAMNAIPRSCKGIFVVPILKAKQFEEVLIQVRDIMRNELQVKEQNFQLDIILDQKDLNEQIIAYNPHSTIQILKAINILPYGVLQMSSEYKDVVELSSNIGMIELQAPTEISKPGSESNNEEILCKINVLPRSLKESELDWMLIDIQSQMHLIGGHINHEYTRRHKAWTPQTQGELVKKAKDCIREANKGAKAKEVVMCGTTEMPQLLIKIPDSQGISIGCRVDNLHSPQEMVYIDTAEPAYEALVRLLSRL
ncbi:MAG: putative Cytosol non-specific dipeptidase [Streblomastix strix]|uniref:Putative Cytosol non-specific dipeptidase n=1 Tax=Streblomastix strix TaxID=222440 RepID=A0A5J4VL35_9EUKA|nr:MAG: putative Cytosol non-specific dipeptidase [Streblomastix strix]